MEKEMPKVDNWEDWDEVEEELASQQVRSKIKHKLQKESKVKQNVKHKKESDKDSSNGS
jgi:hypothetical protein